MKRRFSRLPLKSSTEMEFMRLVGNVVANTLAVLSEAAEPGVTTGELDRIAHATIVDLGAKPNFLGYGGFPASACISVNEQVVHGIPGERVLKPGDIVSFDCGAVMEFDGLPWHGDAAVTVVLDGGDEQLSLRRRELSQLTCEAMWAGVASVASALRVNEIGSAIEDFVMGFSDQLDWKPGIVEGYTGHGIGNVLHQAPTVYNHRTGSLGPRMRPGMVLCVEPMLVCGNAQTRVLGDGWTVVTSSGRDAAHWENTVAVGEKGISVLTALDNGKEGLAPYGIVPVDAF